MPFITFEPSGITIPVEPGTELVDASRQAGVEIELPCGGKGTCGDCAVRIISGDVDADSHGDLPQAAIDDGYVLACKVRILDSDVTVNVPKHIAHRGGAFTEDVDVIDVIDRELLPSEDENDPLVLKLTVDVPQPQKTDGFSDLDRLTAALQRKAGKKDVAYPLPIIRQVADVLRAGNGTVTLTIVRRDDSFKVTHIEPGERTDNNYGIVVDVGTTTVTVQLVSVQPANILTTLSDYNGQIACGLDVISRINYARRPDRLEELRSRVLKTINDLATLAADEAGIKSDDIVSCVISGNTTMTHLLLGLNPEYIRLEPYTPTIFEVPPLSAEEIGIRIKPQSLVTVSPCVGSYVGGDITSGILCTDLVTDSEDISLFIDIGTNGELVVGNKDFLITCACSAGPAFEGSGISCGMRAATGAIDRVEVDHRSGRAQYQTIGDVPPQGICGSGIISLLAQLFQTGWIDAAGKLTRSRASEFIEISGRNARYTIVPAAESVTGDAISIDEKDIENIVRAKAAIYSACSLVLDQVGIRFDDLAGIYLAGGFGRSLDLEKAVVIGLLPDLPRERFHYIGNSSLKGGYMALVSRNHWRRQLDHARRMTYLELSTDPGYMDQYTGALFLPHTDMSRFPSVKTIGYNGS